MRIYSTDISVFHFISLLLNPTTIKKKKDNNQSYNSIDKPDLSKTYRHYYKKETVPFNWPCGYRKG